MLVNESIDKYLKLFRIDESLKRGGDPLDTMNVGHYVEEWDWDEVEEGDKFELQQDIAYFYKIEEYKEIFTKEEWDDMFESHTDNKAGDIGVIDGDGDLRFEDGGTIRMDWFEDRSWGDQTKLLKKLK